MSKHCQQKNCQKKDCHHEKKHCEEKFCRYDSWEDCEPGHCSPVTEKVRTVVIRQHAFCQKRNDCVNWGFTTKKEGCWENVDSCKENGRLDNKVYHKK